MPKLINLKTKKSVKFELWIYSQEKWKNRLTWRHLEQPQQELQRAE